MQDLLSQIRQCRVCENSLPLGPRPIVQGDPNSRLLIVGQAPGLAVHETGIAWDDASGERLRDWLGITSSGFYNPKIISILPVGFCYPGRAKSGDAAPRKECFPLWHSKFVRELKSLQLTLLVGQYAQEKYLQERRKENVTETIRAWREYTPEFIPLPHPSPRNNIWLAKNEWFLEKEVPHIRKHVQKILKK